MVVIYVIFSFEYVSFSFLKDWAPNRFNPIGQMLDIACGFAYAIHEICSLSL